MEAIFAILGVVFIIFIVIAVYENKKGKNDIWIGDQYKTTKQKAHVNFMIASQKYKQGKFTEAILYFEKSIEHNPPQVNTMLCTCCYLKGQQMLAENGNDFNMQIITVYKKGFNAIQKALEYQTTNEFDIMQRNYLAGVMSGALNTFYGGNFSDTKRYLSIAIDHGSQDSRDLLSALNKSTNYLEKTIHAFIANAAAKFGRSSVILLPEFVETAIGAWEPLQENGVRPTKNSSVHMRIGKMTINESTGKPHYLYTNVYGTKDQNAKELSEILLTIDPEAAVGMPIRGIRMVVHESLAPSDRQTVYRTTKVFTADQEGSYPPEAINKLVT
jgi:tetratricopeptide (TPR) repeat protein